MELNENFAERSKKIEYSNYSSTGWAGNYALAKDEHGFLFGLAPTLTEWKNYVPVNLDGLPDDSEPKIMWKLVMHLAVKDRLGILHDHR